MLPFYVGALALGGVLIAASIFLGGDSDADADVDLDADIDVDVDADVDVDLDIDADVDVDADIDADADVDAHAGPGLVKDADAGTWLPFLSVRFWTFGLASFGLTGTLLSLLGFGDALAAPVSAGLGLCIGWAAAWAFRKLKGANVTADTGLSNVAGTEGEVLLPVGPGKRGKVRALIGGRWVDLLAETGDSGLLERREKILVVGVTDGVAQVTRLRQLSGHAD